MQQEIKIKVDTTTKRDYCDPLICIIIYYQCNLAESFFAQMVVVVLIN